MDERKACIILNLIGGIGPARLERLVNAFGSPSAIFDQTHNNLCSVAGIKNVLAEKITAWKDSVDYDKEMEMVERGGVELITRYDSEYPDILKEIPDPPLCLYIRGRLPDFTGNSIAIVGSRRVTTYGRKMAKFISESASYAGWTIVSGLAYGIDSVAHQACVETGGTTVAVLGGGLAHIHPQEHIPLARQIAETGAVISEFPMTYPPCRRSFPMRNRVVSGLTLGTIVVEAGFNSGSLITANQALEQGKLVFAVPGNADQPQSRGCNALIKQGAKLVENFDDVLDEFEYLPGFNLREESRKLPLEGGNDVKSDVKNLKLDEDEHMILAHLKKGDSSLDGLSEYTGFGTGKLLSLLMKLEVKKCIKELPGKIYQINY